MKESGTWFPADVEAAFAASVRLPRGTALLVDTGSPGNIVGSEWVKDHADELQQASLPAPRYSQRQRMLTCSGVGTGTQQASHDVEVPIGLGNGRLDGYKAPELPNSRTPALLGRIAMREKRCLVDTFTNKLFMVGPGGYEIKLSPGSEIYDLEDSEAGHQMLPCSQFHKGRKPTKDGRTFLVGDYFEADKQDYGVDVSPTSGPGSQRWNSALKSFDQKASETLDFLDEADALP